jgi:hypothetical protein
MGLFITGDENLLNFYEGRDTKLRHIATRLAKTRIKNAKRACLVHPAG